MLPTGYHATCRVTGVAHPLKPGQHMRVVIAIEQMADFVSEERVWGCEQLECIDPSWAWVDRENDKPLVVDRTPDCGQHERGFDARLLCDALRAG